MKKLFRSLKKRLNKKPEPPSNLFTVIDKGSNNRFDLTGLKRQNSKGYVTFEGSNNEIIIDPDARIEQLTLFISGDNHRLVIGKVSFIEVGICFVDNGSTVTIGDNTTMVLAELSVAEGKDIEIKEDCQISTKVHFFTSDFHSIQDATTLKRINPPQSIVLENHVWVGENVQVLKGCHIGENSIIGINSVVAGRIPANVVAAGQPAKVIRENVTWNRDRLPWDQPAV